MTNAVTGKTDHCEMRQSGDKSRCARSLRTDFRFAKLFLLLAFFGRLQTGISSGSKFILEFLDATSCVYKLQFARVKWMAARTNVDFQLAPCTTSGKAITTPAFDCSFNVIGMYAVFHNTSNLRFCFTQCETTKYKHLYRYRQEPNRGWSP